MGDWTPAPFVGGAYSDDTKAWNCQDTVNFIPVRTERPNGRSDWKLVGAPGFYAVADTKTNAPIRGMRNVEGLFLVVAGTTLFKVAADFTVTAIGTIPGVLRVSMAHNQIAGGNEVAIANGQSCYVYNTVAGTLAQITDDAFPGALTVDFIDGYITYIDPSRNFAGISDLADAMAYSELDRVQAEGSPDKLVGQIVDHREWWLFGEATIEPYQNTGAATGTFQRAGGTVIDVGAASPHAIVKMDNSVFWLGSDGIVYRANGYTPQRLSLFPIEQAIARSTSETAFAFTFEDRGHKIFYLTFLDGQTWGFDVATQEWHRRESRGLDRWRINDLVKWNGSWIGGDFSNGKLYKLDWNVMEEDGEIMERRRVTGVLHNNQNAIIVAALALVIDTGMPAGLPPMFVNGDVPDGAFFSAIDTQYQTFGGKPPYTYRISSGGLPPTATLDTSGHATGTRTDAGSTYTWVVESTDAAGRVARLVDSCKVGDGLGPGQANWRYLATTLDDPTDRSATAFDDSGWALGSAPFGNLDKNPGAGQLPYQFDPRLKTTIATKMALNTRMWIRRTLVVSTVPEDGFHLVGYFDNSYALYVNGALAASGEAVSSAGVDIQLPASFFHAGVNVIAVQCDDDLGEVDIDTCYFDFLLDAL